MKRLKTITGIVDAGLITSTVITGGTSITTSASGVALPVGIILGGFSVFFSITTLITPESLKILSVRQGKHNAIKLLAQSKLNSMANIISQAMQDGNISPSEFKRVLHEVEKYCKLKADIENLAEAKIKQIMEKQREEIFEEGRKKGVEDFLRKIANPSGTQGVNAILNMNLPHHIACDFMVYKRL